MKYSSYLINACIMLMILTALAFSGLAEECFANSGDETAPTINSITINNNNSVDARENMVIDIDLIEDGIGVSEIYMGFNSGNKSFTGYFFYYPVIDKSPLFTGHHTLSVPINGNDYIGPIDGDGSYILESVIITDRNGNQTSYLLNDINAICETRNIELTNVSGGDDHVAPVINSLKVLNTEALNCEKMSVEIDVTEDGEGLSLFRFVFEAPGGEEILVSLPVKDKLRTGHYTIKDMPITAALYNAKYKITSIDIVDANNNSTTYTVGDSILPEPIEVTVVNAQINYEDRDVGAPVINSVNFPEDTVMAPGAFQVELNLVEEDNGVSSVDLLLKKNDSDYSFYLQWYNNPKEKRLFTGEQTISIPVSPFVPSGDYTITRIDISDDAHWVSKSLNEAVTINSPYEVAYVVALENTAALMGNTENMTDGQAMLVECRGTTIIPKAVFEAIAGKDIVLAFQCEDTLWVFDGKKIGKTKCKDVDINTNIYVDDGIVMGFENNEQVLVIDFKNNGVLPGEAEIRINSAYISAKYASGVEHLVLSYIKGMETTVEDSNVLIGTDEAAVLRITHNSRYTLSRNRLYRSISKAKVSVSNCIYSGKWRKPSVTVKLEGKKLDSKYYTKKYKNNKKVGIAKAKVYGNKKYGYNGTASGSFKINPKKAAIAKVVAGKKRITVKMKSKPSALGGTTYKIQYRIAGKGKWKSTTTKGASKTIKGLKTGKKYQVKVRAYKGKRQGAISATKKSGKVK